jgi:simple sugar transport system permease protein
MAGEGSRDAAGRAALSPALAVAAPVAASPAARRRRAVRRVGRRAGQAHALIFEGSFTALRVERDAGATPLMLTGLAAAIAFRAHLYNIGAEGQLLPGALPRSRSAVFTAVRPSLCRRRSCSPR